MPPQRHTFLSGPRKLAYQWLSFWLLHTRGSLTCILIHSRYSLPFPESPALLWYPSPSSREVPFHAMWHLVKEMKVSFLPQLHSFTNINSDLTLHWAFTPQGQTSLSLPDDPDEGPAQSLPVALCKRSVQPTVAKCFMSPSKKQKHRPPCSNIRQEE